MMFQCLSLYLGGRERYGGREGFSGIFIYIFQRLLTHSCIHSTAFARVYAPNEIEWPPSKSSNTPCARGSVRRKLSSRWQRFSPSSKRTKTPTTRRKIRKRNSQNMAHVKTRLSHRGRNVIERAKNA